jgi:5'-3' exonuclease
MRQRRGLSEEKLCPTTPPRAEQEVRRLQDEFRGLGKRIQIKEKKTWDHNVITPGERGQDSVVPW